MTKNLLAKKLQKYYTRKGNRFVFPNGISLNQLSLEMWEKLGYKGIDASVLSRVIDGERLFTVRQVDAFCEALSLSENDRRELIEGMSVDLAERYGLTFNLHSGGSSYVGDILEENVKKIREARLSDAIVFASGWAEDLREVLREQIADEKNTTYRSRLFLLLAKLLRELGHLKLGTSLAKSLSEELGPAASELIKVGEILKDESIVGNGYSFIGTVYYVLKDYAKAVTSLEKVVAQIEDPEEKCFCIRLLALSYAYLGKKEEFLRIKKEMMFLENQLSSNERCELYEGLGRGLALIGYKKESEYFMRKSADTLRMIEKQKSSWRIARKLQLTRTQIEVGMVNGDRAMMRDAEFVGTESVRISKMFGYNSFGEKIQNLLVRLSS